MSEGDRLPAGWESGYADAGGVDVRYVRSGGGGPPFVIAHGITDDALTRLPLARDLQDDFDVIAYDARGHGRSDAPGTGYDVDGLVADLEAVVDGLGLGDPILFGHSLGGNTVAAAAARNPGLARAVVLEDPAGMLVYGDGNEDVERLDVATARERFSRWSDCSVAELLETDDTMAAYAASGRRNLAERLAEARRRVDPNAAAIYGEPLARPADVYPGLDAPTLILRADGDGATRRADRELAATLPDGRLVHVDGAGHTVFRDRYDEAYRELRAFLEEV